MGAADSINPNTSLWGWLAHDLRFYRLKHGLSQSQMGKIMGRAASSLSNCEAGRRKITDKEAKRLDDYWDTGGHFLRLLTFARLNHNPDWFRQHIQYEAIASVLRIYELAFVPGLFQTPAYARALFTEVGSKDVDGQVAARIARQEILNRSQPPEVWVLLDEGVIRHLVGAPELAREQFARLLEVSELPNVSLRVVRMDAGFHRGMEGSFKVMKADGADVAYTEAAGGGRLVLDSGEAENFAIRFDRIGARALPVHTSRDLLKQAMEDVK